MSNTETVSWPLASRDEKPKKRESQLNVRMDAQLKADGDEALASIGLTPSQAVRALWQLAAERGEGLDQAKKLLVENPREKESSPSAFLEGVKSIERKLRELGLEHATLPDAPEEELQEEMLLERMQERGLM